MSASFPTSVRTLIVPTAGSGILFTDVANMSEEVTAMLTALVNGRARASVYKNGTQSVNSGTLTALNFDSEDFDVGAMHDNVTNNTRVTIPASNNGIYLVMGAATFAANATGNRQLVLRKNGTTDMRSVTLPNTGATAQQMQVAAVLALVATDYIELTAGQDTGGALNVGSATRASSSELVVARLW
jgi:hypothetical protein